MLASKFRNTGQTCVCAKVGRKLMAQSAQTIKKLSLELGGNAPFIVFNDANIESAVKGILASKFRNTGQTCVCANRIYVQSGIYDELTQELKKEIALLKIGNGLENGITQGQIIDEKALFKVKEHIQDAINKGAQLIIGGKPHERGFNFFEPTILTDVNQNMLVAKEETFGPLAPLFKFETEEEVIQMANDTEFGLASYIYTKDLSRLWRVCEALESGMVGVNTGIISTEVAPFGGIKQSGLGREGSKYGIEDYLELKYLCVHLDTT
uniref:aldehyde dehydrogenase family protein n=1 Tax=Campylobacter hepaticus TaxID=1813019 RepID=UPI0038510D79